jgi:dTDP-4-amino-4,6-dideoxygalactose transaminase
MFNTKSINVTKTFLPDKKKYFKYVDKIYENEWITNSGPLVKELEIRLQEYLGVKNLILVSSGTTALEVAYRTLSLSGSVITTPFSFVASISSLVTNNLHPIFCDIDKETCNMDESRIESIIQQDTSAIVPVHTFGNACDIGRIQSIATQNQLKVVYDASHTFGVMYKNRGILSYGDISTISFHATKLFHTIEGGALIIEDDSLVEKARYLINFGIKNQEEIPHLGINAKMNEFEAAMGLCLLDDMDYIISERKKVYDCYIGHLNAYVAFPKRNKNSTNNYGYFPILLKNEVAVKSIQQALNAINVFPRRYFYPSLDTLSYIEPKQVCTISRDVSSRILCLPIFHGLSEREQLQIINVIRDSV